MQLPDSDTVFEHFFARWFSPDDPRQPMVRSDLEELELEPGQHPRVLSPLNEEGRRLVKEQLDRTTQAALADLSLMAGLEGDLGSEHLDTLEEHFDPEALQKLFRQSNPERPDNPYFVVCCELGAYIAAVLLQQAPRLQWLGDVPYFESALFDLNTRIRIPVFHWAVKSLSGDERKALSGKVAATVEALDGQPG